MELKAIIPFISQFLYSWLISILIQIGAIGATYSLLVNLYLILHFTVGEKWKVISLLNNASHLILLGSVIAFLATLISPYRSIWIIYAAPGLIAFIAWYGWLFFPKQAINLPSDSITLRVATFNVAGNFYGDQSLRPVLDFDADILGTQETSLDFMNALVPYYPYYVQNGQIVIFSRYPILEEEIRIIGSPPSLLTPIALRVVVNVNNKNISVYIAHPKRPELEVRPLIYDDAERKSGVSILIESLEQETNPVIMLCDCNMGDRSDDYKKLKHFLQDGWYQRGWGLGLTAPANQKDTPIPLLRSDMIWHSKEIITVSIKRGNDSGDSDHYPVLAEIAVRGDA